MKDVNFVFVGVSTLVATLVFFYLFLSIIFEMWKTEKYKEVILVENIVKKLVCITGISIAIIMFGLVCIGIKTIFG